MLARANRITDGADYRSVVRRGVRIRSANTITYIRRGGGSETVRFGFIVSKSVGAAVVRNKVRRRLKAVAYEAVAVGAPGEDIVVRALPASVDATWVTLQEEIFHAVTEGQATT